ncbi:hypothetical protein HKD42_00785 [Altererythrobacter sp. RZ02]|uniref:Lipopolysaccharide biosynthesis protein n=1 Tax=Pontixanthobacter rizhaonensis TaxID=2730337 RepID=A0A848QIU5_9SPHN|nr:hypothetical protein [Pontixanthobacter rizhaonensis]NMW30593.1 hypothetical protein [Pontixanthobacter rizhaonensis]
MEQENTQPRRIVKFWMLVRDGLPSVGRYRRYIIAVLPPLAAIWLLTIAYVALAPTRYESEMTLILPGSGVGGSLNLESIGQASGTAASAFSSTTLSPTENYKRLLMSDRVVSAAAELAGEEAGAFPQPSIKLVDQTNLIAVDVTGSSPEQAQQRNAALREVFLAALDDLRNDEAVHREEADQARIAALAEKVEEAQRKVLEFQGRSGLVSLDQFNNRIAAMDDLKAREREARTARSQNAAVAGRLASTLRVSTGTANRALRLSSDQAFQQLLGRYSEVLTKETEQGGTLGPAHAKMEALRSEREELEAALSKRGATVTGLRSATVMKFAELSVSDTRASLFEGLLLSDSSSAGSNAALAEIRRQIGQQSAKTGELVEQASELAGLTRELRVAEAVFSSALARVDTNKSDPFASYPLVQTLEAPSLPRTKASPKPVFAIAGAFAASILLLIGFMLLWLRQPIIRKILPNV